MTQPCRACHMQKMPGAHGELSECCQQRRALAQGSGRPARAQVRVALVWPAYSRCHSAAHPQEQRRVGATCWSSQPARFQTKRFRRRSKGESRDTVEIACTSKGTQAQAHRDAHRPFHPMHAGSAGTLPVTVEKDPAGHGEQSASDDRFAPAPRHRPRHARPPASLVPLPLHESGCHLLLCVSGRVAGASFPLILRTGQLEWRHASS